MKILRMAAHLYRSFDADYAREVPGEGYGGWDTAEVEFALERTALVSMHAWDAGSMDAYPGVYRCEEYLPRANRIVREVFPPLLAAARAAGLTVFHVAGGGRYYQDLPGYRRAAALAGPEPAPPEGPAPDPLVRSIQDLKAARFYPGEHNRSDIRRCFAEQITFPAGARPRDDEGVAETARQLNALCRAAGITHLIYIGFAINWCLLMSPAGMVDMSRLGYLCSAVREATTAVESRESARGERYKEEGLWRVALGFGLVFDAPALTAALRSAAGTTPGENAPGPAPDARHGGDL